MTDKSQSVEILATDEKDAKKQSARLCFNPAVNSATILVNTNKGFAPDLMSLIGEVNNELDKILKGNTDGIERMLMAQAMTLQSVFTSYTNKLISAEYTSHIQIYSKLALKAQNQCRQTLATLADIKNPNRTTFIKNSATNQQINLNSPEKNQNKANELLSEQHHAPMDITGTATPITANQELETVEA